MWVWMWMWMWVWVGKRENDVVPIPTLVITECHLTPLVLLLLFPTLVILSFTPHSVCLLVFISFFCLRLGPFHALAGP